MWQGTRQAQSRFNYRDNSDGHFYISLPSAIVPMQSTGSAPQCWWINASPPMDGCWLVLDSPPVSYQGREQLSYLPPLSTKICCNLFFAVRTEYRIQRGKMTMQCSSVIQINFPWLAPLIYLRIKQTCGGCFFLSVSVSDFHWLCLSQKVPGWVLRANTCQH